MVALTNVAAVSWPWIFGYAVDRFDGEISRKLLLYCAGAIVGVSLLEGIFRYLMRRILIGASRYIEYDLRNDVFAHLQTLSPEFYHRYPTGDILSRATNDLSAVRMVLGPGIMYSINALFTALFTIPLLITINLQLSILTLLPLVLVSSSVKYFGKRIHLRFEKIQEQLSTLTTMVQENVSGVRVARAYDQGKAFIRRFRKANDEYIRRSLSLVKIWGIFYPLLPLLLGFSSVVILWYGGRLVIQGSFTLGDLFRFMAYLSMLTWPTIALGWVINIFERGSASMGRLNHILTAEPKIRDEHPVSLSELNGDITVKDLNFSYNGRRVLEGISFRVCAGQTVAIVGGTGSGKSTLANLLCRLYTVPDEAIFIDGVDINKIPLSTLRRAIGYIPQETFLFSETIRENIAFGSFSASLKRIQEVATVSHIWPEIQEFPRRLETFVGERGITLSGGQKQRIAISRALLINPKILILDDALSGVDTYTENRILKNLSQELADRTTILISHRISTIKTADQILVLEDGVIVERGSHNRLLELSGQYAQLYKKQLLREELGVK